MNGLNEKSVFQQSDFFFNCLGHIPMNSKLDYDAIKSYIWKFWDAHRNPNLTIDETVFVPGEAKPAAQVNHVSEKTRPTCDYCKNHKKRLQKTHKTDKCFFGDKPGYDKLTDKEENTDSSSYFASLTFFDTGCI